MEVSVFGTVVIFSCDKITRVLNVLGMRGSSVIHRSALSESSPNRNRLTKFCDSPEHTINQVVVVATIEFKGACIDAQILFELARRVGARRDTSRRKGLHGKARKKFRSKCLKDLKKKAA
jgi:hypothetical protein